MASQQTRRSILKVSGSLLGGLAVGSTVTTGTSTDRFIIDSTHISNRDVTTANLAIVHDLSEINLLVVRGSETDVQSLNGHYAPDSYISLDQPVNNAPITIEDAGETRDEPYYSLQWDKEAQNVPEAHDISRGEGTRVTVIDTGVAAGHPDLAHAVNEDLSRNFTGDQYGAGGPYGGYHGSHVAGIIAANDQNDAGVVGTAPATEIVDCRVFSPGQLASFADVLAAIVYSVRIDADAANMSIGAYPIPRQGLGQFYGKALNRVTTYANSNGTLLIAAAGNDSADLQHDGGVISLPNEAANTMSISATGPIGFGWGDDDLKESFRSPAFYTNYGTNAIDVGAPGGDADIEAAENDVPGWYYDLVLNVYAVPQYKNGNYQGAYYSYAWAAGTSMACPQVVGAAALVKSQNPDYNANQVRQTLENTAERVDEYDKTYYGSGFLNSLAAVER